MQGRNSERRTTKEGKKGKTRRKFSNPVIALGESHSFSFPWSTCWYTYAWQHGRLKKWPHSVHPRTTENLRRFFFHLYFFLFFFSVYYCLLLLLTLVVVVAVNFLWCAIWAPSCWGCWWWSLDTVNVFKQKTRTFDDHINLRFFRLKLTGTWSGGAIGTADWCCWW